ncbi:hypothetical protein FDECE_9773 [Fusarium decemcellulare]|nr:hypothetical protein FDECE_9773 [Fusarium decemcellulare]
MSYYYLDNVAAPRANPFATPQAPWLSAADPEGFFILDVLRQFLSPMPLFNEARVVRHRGFFNGGLYTVASPRDILPGCPYPLNVRTAYQSDGVLQVRLSVAAQVPAGLVIPASSDLGIFTNTVLVESEGCKALVGADDSIHGQWLASHFLKIVKTVESREESWESIFQKMILAPYHPEESQPQQSFQPQQRVVVDGNNFYRRNKLFNTHLITQAL